MDHGDVDGADKAENGGDAALPLPGLLTAPRGGRSVGSRVLSGTRIVVECTVSEEAIPGLGAGRAMISRDVLWEISSGPSLDSVCL